MSADKVRLYVKPYGPRPYYYSVAAFLWNGRVNFDSDGNCEHPNDRNWTELTVSNRDGPGDVSIDPLRDKPLVLVVASKEREEAARAAYYVALKTNGTISWSKEGPFVPPDELRNDLGQFDLAMALQDAEQHDK